MLEFVEIALGQIALPVDAPVYAPLNEPVAGRRDMGLRATRADHLEQGIGVVSAIGDDVAALEPVDEVWRGFKIVRLTGGEDQPHRQAMFSSTVALILVLSPPRERPMA